MTLPLVFLLAAQRYVPEMAPVAYGTNHSICVATLHNGDRIVDGARERSRFWFDRDYAFERFEEGDGAGDGVYKRFGSGWCVLSRGGGAVDESYLVRLGVPPGVAHHFLNVPSSQAGHR